MAHRFRPSSWHAHRTVSRLAMSAISATYRRTSRSSSAKALRRLLEGRSSDAMRSAVPGQLQRRPEHLGRDGLLAGQPALQRPLLADAQAPGEELLLVELLGGVGRGQLLGDHRVGVEERAQDQVRHVRPGTFQPPLRVVRAHLGAHLADVRVDQRQLRLQLVGEVAPPGEEEVELQQLTQSQCLIPRAAPGPVPAPPTATSTSSAIARTTSTWIALLRYTAATRCWSAPIPHTVSVPPE